MTHARFLYSGDRIMYKLWRRAWLPALLFSISGIIQTTPAPAQDSSAKPSGVPMTPAQQDHVTASRSDAAVKETPNDGNRAVRAAPKPGDSTHRMGAARRRSAKAAPTTGATAPRPKASSSLKPGANGHYRAPTEAHSALKENPKLPSRLPPAQGASSAPPPNQHAEEPQSP